jgi:hypothetical protein
VVTVAGFFTNAHDPALFVHVSPCGRTLLLYMDDMIITGDDPEYIAFIKARLSDQFLMTDLASWRYFLGIEISSTPEGFFLSQGKYIQHLLDRASLTDHWTVETSMKLNVHLTPTDDEPLEDFIHYRHIVGSLVYLGVTRPDISYSVHILSQFVYAPTQIHYSHLFVSCVIFVGLALVACSFHVLALYNFRHIVMLSGLVIPLTVVPFPPIVLFLVVPSLLERLKSS